jgi:hypothetical protein
MLENQSISRPPVADHSACNRSKITNKPLHRWKGNTPEGRRCRDIFRALMHAAGQPTDPAIIARLASVADTAVLTDTVRERAARGEPVDYGALHRMEARVDREFRRLGLVPKPAPAPVQPPSPLLSSLIRQARSP